MATIIGKISIPKNAYSLYDIAKIEKIPIAKIEKLMGDALSRATQTAPIKTPTGIERYFNTIGCNDGFVNVFLTHWGLQPFAKGIRLTIEKSMKNSGLKDYLSASFFVEKITYENWKKRGIVYTGEIKKAVQYDKMAALTKFTVVLPNTIVAGHFKKVVTALGFKLSEAILMALDFFMQSKSDIFGEYGTDVKSEYLTENEISLVFGYVDKKVVNKVWKTIQRWNAKSTPTIKFSEFLESALIEKLDRLPLEITDLELFKELEDLKQQEQRTAEFLNKGGNR